jgi:hypothetical protein
MLRLASSKSNAKSIENLAALSGWFSARGWLPPAKGPFSIICKDLKPGTYLVAAQPASMRREREVLGACWLQKNGKSLQIEVTKDSMPSIVDVGAVTIQMPY